MHFDRGTYTNAPFRIIGRSGVTVLDANNNILELTLAQIDSIFSQSGGGNMNTVATTAPVGNGTTIGDLWINKITNETWVWTGSAWQQIIGQ